VRALSDRSFERVLRTFAFLELRNGVRDNRKRFDVTGVQRGDGARTSRIPFPRDSAGSGRRTLRSLRSGRPLDATWVIDSGPGAYPMVSSTGSFVSAEPS
jgi:hypothetical protein